jgi:hypothetical protein
MLRCGARCISASRLADSFIGDGGLLSVTLIRREPPKACMPVAQESDGSRIWLSAGCR